MKEIENYCLNVPHFVHLYFWVPAPLRRIFWHLSPQGFGVRSCIKKLKYFIVPKVRETLDAWRKGNRTSEEYTLLGAMLDVKEERGTLKRDGINPDKAEEERQVDIFSDEVIFTGFDSAGPVACLVTQLLFESIADKELTEALRSEIAAALDQHAGDWSSPAMMSSLPILESFTRETLRVDGPTLCKFKHAIISHVQAYSSRTSLTIS